jgi:hypothetical protein
MTQKHMFPAIERTERAQKRIEAIAEEMKLRTKELKAVGTHISNFAKLSADIYLRCDDVERVISNSELTREQSVLATNLVRQIRELAEERKNLDAQLEEDADHPAQNVFRPQRPVNVKRSKRNSAEPL